MLFFKKNISAIFIDNDLVLSFELPENHISDEIIFFPDEYGLIDYSKDQIIERNDNSVSISSIKLDSVSYTHLTLPTNREV